MKILYFAVLAVFVSCAKSIEEKCFLKEDDPYFKGYVEKKPFTVQQILEHKPDYLTIIPLKKYRSFKQDSLEYKRNRAYTEDYWKQKETEFSDFNEKFLGQFDYSFKQTKGSVKYALGANNLGYWLLKIEKDRPSAYFLGLSFSHFYFNKVQQNHIVKDGFFQIEGSLVQIIKVPGLPGYDDFSAIGDGKLFKISLSDLEKDSDKDDYNDIFEKSFGLNPQSKDTDGDGISDFKDRNPLFKSEKNKFTGLYENLMSQHTGSLQENLKNRDYFISAYETDCDYFQKINPEHKVLIFSENPEKQPYYVRSTAIFGTGYSLLKKDKTNPQKFYINEAGSGSVTGYSAEYKNGKWVFTFISQTVS